METPYILEGDQFKICRSENYNFEFDKRSGWFRRYGKTLEDDPQWSPYGPEIADVEICAGKCLGKCCKCYKQNNLQNISRWMSLETWRKIFAKFPKVLTQVAFGITDIYANPDFFEILKFTREQGVIPNYTTHGLDVDEKCVGVTKKYCGAVAVSVVDKKLSYQAIRDFIQAGMKQTNIHFCLSQESYDDVFGLISDIRNDPILSKINAVVFLQYKHKNPRSPYHSMLDVNKYVKIMKACEKAKIGYGFDSCSARLFECAATQMDWTAQEQKNMIALSESCESFGNFSCYVNMDGQYFPCSFCEGKPGWEYGIDVLDGDFLQNIWLSSRLQAWRAKSLNTCYPTGCRKCLIYPEINL